VFEDRAKTLKHGSEQSLGLELIVQPTQPKSSATLKPPLTTP
jgi:hypothetical protein